MAVTWKRWIKWDLLVCFRLLMQPILDSVARNQHESDHFRFCQSLSLLCHMIPPPLHFFSLQQFFLYFNQALSLSFFFFFLFFRHADSIPRLFRALRTRHVGSFWLKDNLGLEKCWAAVAYHKFRIILCWKPTADMSLKKKSHWTYVSVFINHCY